VRRRHDEVQAVPGVGTCQALCQRRHRRLGRGCRRCCLPALLLALLAALLLPLLARRCGWGHLAQIQHIAAAAAASTAVTDWPANSRL
jgi:hypothetical protein